MKIKSGFTIVELVVVVVIIGILAAMALPQYNKTVERSRQSEALTNLAAIRGAQLRYYYENATAYANSFDNLDIDNRTNGAFFTYYPLNTDPIIASARRNGTKNPNCGTYNITIAVNGTISNNNCPSSCCSS